MIYYKEISQGEILVLVIAVKNAQYVIYGGLVIDNPASCGISVHKRRTDVEIHIVS